MPSQSAKIKTVSCQYCAAQLPQDAQFCIECGQPQGANTIRLPNARVAQSAIGGTIKLASSGAVPPGIWSEAHIPGPTDIIAIYAPLRAIVAGWSAVTQMGWQLVERGPRAHAEATSLYRFSCERDWFPIIGAADNLRLRIRLEALADAEPGRTRQGFRYRIGHDAPMSVADAWWHTASDQERIELPIPQIQIMAPPRVARISDLDEQVRSLPETKALTWAREGQLHEFLHFERNVQQRTPAGRGLLLGAIASSGLIKRWFGPRKPRAVIRTLQPYRTNWRAWGKLQQGIRDEAGALGLDMESDAMIEWWLDKRGHDCAIFEGVAGHYEYDRIVIPFRRSQVAWIEAS